MPPRRAQGFNQRFPKKRLDKDTCRSYNVGVSNWSRRLAALYYFAEVSIS